ncbi:MAG: UDP-2,3-diacylglucosamine diphosphatase LpxI [Pirellulaceae bacterium]|nr:UDP-2,3-diacylglucosamine diphosphatase LpxI [Pirellulaceae bacterium]
MDKALATHSSPPKVGIVAGWGSFPIEVAEHCRALGYEVYIAAIKGHADPKLAQFAEALKWFGVAKLGGQIQFFQRHGVQQITLAGKLFKDKILFHGFGWLEHFPDITCLRTLYRSFITRSNDTRDDTILGAVAGAFTKRNMQVVPATDLAPQLMVNEGCLTRRKPNRRETLDIEFGWQIARQMGGLDVGQSITVRDQTVLGVEAVEGTDALIQRTGQLCPRGGFTLVKVAKPKQDMRFDVPTIGLRTIENLIRAGGRTIAIEAHRTILVDREQTLAYANQHGVAIIAVHIADAANVDSQMTSPLTSLSSLAPTTQPHRRSA